MDKKEILDILDNAKDERGAVPMRLVRQAFDKLVQPEERTETRACELISRQAAIDALDCINGVEEVLRSLPSAQPEAPCYLGSPCEYQNPNAEIQEERTEKRTETHACGLISRQQAIDALAEQMPTPYTPDGSHPADEGIFAAQEVYADCIETIELLPPAHPERKKGRWIQYDKRFLLRYHYKCSECGNYLDFSCVNAGRGDANYCPNCGADMRGERNG